jgi:hypothetical protein
MCGLDFPDEKLIKKEEYTGTFVLVNMLLRDRVSFLFFHSTKRSRLSLKMICKLPSSIAGKGGFRYGMYASSVRSMRLISDRSNLSIIFTCNLCSSNIVKTGSVLG